MPTLLKKLVHKMSIGEMIDKMPLKEEASRWFTNIATSQVGSVSIGRLMMLFIGALFLMALTPSLIDANATIQADTGASDMVKTIIGLLVWAIPAGGGIGIIMAAVNLFKNDD
ncbi:hypothetical protein [Dehalococcoides mccartyi]|uniref:hypothetical protein n=1 Tax=Dehalococcoides mccartyi TaxID=61435 RepID=UPI0003C84D6A|nr:hypothetical protein [Dehalococcoides mccartyi]AHB12895.1 hypothetical protein GY50_0109 [Dehalococcoides mccartyi GY50]